MTVSYTLTSLAAVFLVEILFGAMVWAWLTYGPVVGTEGDSTAQEAKIYALAAAAQAKGGVLDPHTTFEPGQPSSIALSSDYFPNNGGVPYNQASSAKENVTFALLVAPDGRVLASSYPAHYPVMRPVTEVLPGRAGLISNALAGTPGNTVVNMTQGRAIGVVEPVLGSGKKTIGAIYLQSPAFSGNNILQGLPWLFLISGLVFLVLLIPIGSIFGLITTRGLLRRIRNLVAATTQFADGDYAQRVSITRKDEVGQLELRFNEMAQQLVESMEQRQTLVEQNARQAERARIEQEMRTAQNIQKALLPKDVPALPGWQFTPYYKPAKEVGGDFYDFLTFDDGSLGIVIGDVAGKGVPAALVMAITRTMLRTAAQGEVAPTEVLARVNNLLCNNIPAGMFVTCFYAILNPTNGHLRYANAGHDLPYRRHSGRVSELRATGMPLGMMPESSYEEKEGALLSGESILFYSDGLVEAHNPRRDMFGFPHLMALLGEHTCDHTLIDFLLDELATFTGAGWEQEDDVTMVVVNRDPLPPTT